MQVVLSLFLLRIFVRWCFRFFCCVFLTFSFISVAGSVQGAVGAWFWQLKVCEVVRGAWGVARGARGAFVLCFEVREVLLEVPEVRLACVSRCMRCARAGAL